MTADDDYDYEYGPSNLTAVGDTLFFTTDDGIRGQEVWRSDGTKAGTVLVRNIRAGAYGSYPGRLTAVGDELFFRARDGVHGSELWRSDGTKDGTVLVEDIRPGSASASPEGLVVVDDTVFFSVDDGASGHDLWVSDGTEAGTVHVKDFVTSDDDYSYGLGDMTAVGDGVFFAADDGIHGLELWSSDGTEAGTVLVKDIRAGDYPSYPGLLTAVGDTVFFIARDGVHGRELWRSDGTKAGTALVEDVDPNGSADPRELTESGGELFFQADDGLHGDELWRSDGTEPGTNLVVDINKGGAFDVSTRADFNAENSTLRVRAAFEGSGTVSVAPAGEGGIKIVRAGRQRVGRRPAHPHLGADPGREADAPADRTGRGGREVHVRIVRWCRQERDPALHREDAVTAADETAASVDGGPTEVRFHHSTGLPGLLEEARCSLLISTYQAGQVVAVGVADGELTFSFRRFDHAMGLALGADHLAVAGKGQVWMLRDHSELAPAMAPAGVHDRCWLPRSSMVTGGIQCHEIAWGTTPSGEPDLWMVNTRFSCLAGLDPGYSFVPRWRPPFISSLAPQDRCHLNGLAMRDGSPAFVTVMASSDEPGGWRKQRNDTGTVLDVATGEPVTTGLAMPHSPRWHDGQLFVLNSGMGRLERVDLATGRARRGRRPPGICPRAGDPRRSRLRRAVEDPGDRHLRGRPHRGVPRPAQVRRRRHRAQHRHHGRHARVRQRRGGDLRHPGGSGRALSYLRGVGDGRRRRLGPAAPAP